MHNTKFIKKPRQSGSFLLESENKSRNKYWRTAKIELALSAIAVPKGNIYLDTCLIGEEKKKNSKNVGLKCSPRISCRLVAFRHSAGEWSAHVVAAK